MPSCHSLLTSTNVPVEYDLVDALKQDRARHLIGSPPRFTGTDPLTRSTRSGPPLA
jgi:hypothetical protein